MKRTIKPLYAQHQATPWAGLLDPNWNPATYDLLPGMCMVRLGPGEIFTPFVASMVGTGKTFGLSALFVAPILGVDEVTSTGTNFFSVWTGAADAAFNILAPAFDTTATWTNPSNGSRVLLYPSIVAGQIGKLTPVQGAGMNTTDAVCELVDVPDANTITVRFNRFA